MRVNAIIGQSFGKTDKKQTKRNTNEKLAYHTKYNVVNKLKMSKGREAENGKYETASGIAKLASAILFMVGLCRCYDSVAHKTMKGDKITLGILAGSMLTQLASSMIETKNKKEANKTANERGFKTEEEIGKIKNREELVSTIEEQYNAHVK